MGLAAGEAEAEPSSNQIEPLLPYFQTDQLQGTSVTTEGVDTWNRGGETSAELLHTGFRSSASPSCFCQKDRKLLKKDPSHSPVDPPHLYPSTAALSLVPI